MSTRCGIDLSIAVEEGCSVHVFISSISQQSISCSSSFMSIHKISIRDFERGMGYCTITSNIQYEYLEAMLSMNSDYADIVVEG